MKTLLSTLCGSLLLLAAARAAESASPAITLDDFKLVGNLADGRAEFTLSATARVENPQGGSLDLLSGTVALTDLGTHPKWRLRAEPNRFVLVFDRAGKFPIQLKFNIAVRQNEGWNNLEFRVATSTLRPILLQGLSADTQFEFPGAARPERVGGDFKCYLPSDGSVKLSWKEARPEAEGKLFYAAEMFSQISVSPGLMRQVALFDFKVMQGELSRVSLLLRGIGEVTRVQGDQVLAWNLEPAANSADRRLVVQLNQPQKDQFSLQVQVQTPLGAFPQAADSAQLRPESATRFAGYVRIVNDGAVRLEVAQASGLSQISPEQFPESDATRAALRLTGSQRFAYRFSGADFALRIQADQILPELAVSQLLAYHLGESELAIDGEIELDIREAPLRELLLRVPKGYAIARLNASGLNDYFLREPEDQTDAELRLVYGQPVSGRQVIQLRLERNKPLGEPAWYLPRIEVAKAKSVRGHIAVAADAGFRLTSERTQGLTEIATAFFPRKVTGIQSAFRLSDPAWQAALRVERLPQTVQADALHIFSIGEGIAYGSSVINYVVSGAPVAAFKVELSEEYHNVEFTGKDIRGYQKIEGGYLVQLHTPVSGAYTLLAAYERPFKAQGETLAFSGARPLDAQSEQGHTLIISAYQFQVKPAEVSPGLLALEPGEVPPEYRLFFDAPILAAYRYGARPFNLKLALSPLAQGDSLSLVVDRAALTTRISKEGQVLTDARYFVKNRGNPHLRLTLTADTQLWSAAVNGAPVVPVTDAGANLIPLPQGADPNAVLALDLKLATPAKAPNRISIAAPIVAAPVMLAEWKLEPDTGQRLVYRAGSLAPAAGVADGSGFAELARAVTSDDSGALVWLVAALILVAAALVLWRWAGGEGVYKLSLRYSLGVVLGVLAFVFASVAFIQVSENVARQRQSPPRELIFLAPIQQAGSALQLEVSNLADKPSVFGVLAHAWPALLALGVWGYGWIAAQGGRRTACWLLGWTLLAWAALRSPNGAGVFFLIMLAFLFLHVAIPVLCRLAQSPRRPPSAPSPTAAEGAASAAVLLLVGGMVRVSLGGFAYASGCPDGATSPAPCAERTIENSSVFQCLDQGRERSIPKGLCPPAQGCEERATLGNEPEHPANPKGVVAQVARVQPQPRWGCLASQTSTQGSSFLATLGWRTQSLWDWAEWRRTCEGCPTPGRGVNETSNETETQSDVLSCPRTHHALRLTSKAPKHRARPEPQPAAVAEAPRPESVTQEIRIEDKFALATARIRWAAEQGQALPLLFEPAVLTGIHYPSNSLVLAPAPAGSKNTRELRAQRDGTFDLEVQYQLRVNKWETQSNLALPVPYGLVNRLKVTVVNLDVDVFSPQAVTIQRDTVGSNTVASLVLSPAADAWIGWKPRSRDVKREKPVFYAELTQLYVPAAGVIEGLHHVSIRPAQGELSEVVLDVPAGATITDVLDPGKAKAPAETKTPAAAIVSLWRFDPDTRKLRVTLNPPQSRPFTLLVRSQVATGPLPFEQSVGLLKADTAAGQIGLLGVATGNEVQLDTVTVESLSPINLEDFPGDLAATLQAQIPGLTVRRAFRYAEAKATAALKASAVEPDVRVETQDTLSLGEDRTVLAAEATVTITRAGIFRLSFLMPAGFDVESISGPALSHWTELKTDGGRVITLHLRGKTEGQQQFAISLAGPGVKATNAWQVPQLVLREAGKQQGTLLLVPEQGLRLQVATCEGLTQLDPQKSGIKQKGVLAFRVLQTPRSLALGIEQVAPWIQVTSLQHATVSEAQVKLAANLQYQIDNTGLKAFRVFLPTNAESVRFQGEQLADFLPVAGAGTNGLQAWDIKLHRRVIGAYLLQATYQMPIPENAPEIVLRGIQAGEVNLQRGFVTVQSGGRLQVRSDAPPPALQPAEWQSIPRPLQQGLPAGAANFSYRLVEAAFELPLKLERHEAAKLLDARIDSITFNSVISDSGIMLTQARLEVLPGDKRLLNLTLPKDAQFWFAFVNQNGVWPWREQDRILIPLEQPARGDKAIVVEIFYSGKIGDASPRSLDLELVAPKFDLPLENITWRVSLSDKWQVTKWSGSLQLQQEERRPQTAAVDLRAYLDIEATRQREQTKAAEDLLAAGNSALAKGDPQQARRAFQSAYGLSAHDAAFNEDARVQLHNIKLQEALVGLNVRQAGVAGDQGAIGGKLRDLRGRKEVNYTQQDAKDIIDRNSADENAAFMRLAERLIQQQDAAVSSPAALRASIPEQGRVLTFKRAVAVEKQADLKLNLRAFAARPASLSARALALAGTLALMAVLAWAAKWGRGVVKREA